MLGEYPQISFRVRPKFDNLYNYPLPGTDRDLLWYQLSKSTVWVDYVPYAMKQGDEFSLYGWQAIDVYTKYILETPYKDRILEWTYFGNPVDLPTTARIISDSPAPFWLVNTGYDYQIPISGGTAPLTWSIASGFLPYGMYLDEITGTIYGTPAIADIYAFTIKVKDSSRPPAIDSRPYLISIASGIITPTVYEFQTSNTTASISGGILAKSIAGDIVSFSPLYSTTTPSSTTINVGGAPVFTATHDASYNGTTFTFIHNGVSYTATWGSTNNFGIVTILNTGVPQSIPGGITATGIATNTLSYSPTSATTGVSSSTDITINGIPVLNLAHDAIYDSETFTFDYFGVKYTATFGTTNNFVGPNLTYTIGATGVAESAPGGITATGIATN